VVFEMILEPAFDPAGDATTREPPEAVNPQLIEVSDLQLRKPANWIIGHTHLDWATSPSCDEVYSMESLLPDETREAPRTPRDRGYRSFVHVRFWKVGEPSNAPKCATRGEWLRGRTNPA